MVDLVSASLALVGGLLVLLAGVGVVRFPDVLARMHAATKASSLGIVLIGLAGAITLDGGRAKALLALAFILITAPSAAHLVALAVDHRPSPVATDPTEDEES